MERHLLSETPANFLVTGSVGSGKNTTLRLLLGSVLPHIGIGLNHRALIYDTRGVMSRVLKDSKFNFPCHSIAQGVAWDIAADITSPPAARQMVDTLIPMEYGWQPFFIDAARQVLLAICLSYIEVAPGKWTLRDLLCAVRNREQLLSLLRGGPEIATALSILNDQSFVAGVLSTIISKIGPLEATATAWDQASEKLSLEEWLRGEGVLCLGAFPAPLQHVIFNHAADLILSQRDSTDKRTWIFLDDVVEMKRLDRFGPLLQASRAKGACVAFGFGDIEFLQKTYGQHAAEELTSQCGFKTALRTWSPATAIWAERVFGSPLKSADLISMPPPGPKHGFAAFHHTPKGGTFFAHKSWEWVLANL